MLGSDIHCRGRWPTIIGHEVAAHRRCTGNRLTVITGYARRKILRSFEAAGGVSMGYPKELTRERRVARDLRQGGPAEQRPSSPGSGASTLFRSGPRSR